MTKCLNVNQAWDWNSSKLVNQCQEHQIKPTKYRHITGYDFGYLKEFYMGITKQWKDMIGNYFVTCKIMGKNYDDDIKNNNIFNHECIEDIFGHNGHPFQIVWKHSILCSSSI